MTIPRPSRLLSLSLAATLVALAIGAIYAAGHVEIRPPPPLGLSSEPEPRRHADPSLGARRSVVPVRRLSRVHVAVAARARAGGVQSETPWSRELPVDVVLDTGASLAFGTARMGLELPLRTAPVSRGARGFSGSRGVLYPLELGERLAISLPSASVAQSVLTRVDYIAPASLHDAHVIAPPQALAPIGGAVRLDLARDELTICESLDACREGEGYHALAPGNCAEDPELVGIEVSVHGHALPMHLDTGAPTLLFRRYYDAAKLGEATQQIETGALSGIGGLAPDARLATGVFRFALGSGQPVSRDAALLWVVGAPGTAGPTRCFPAGSVGVDLLEGCQIVIGERPPLRGFVRCQAPP